jgi:putative transposase
VPQPSSLYKRYRFPGELISHAVWLYYRFLLSYRDVEELLAERGIAVSYETIRRWCRRRPLAIPHARQGLPLFVDSKWVAKRRVAGA